MRNLILGMKNVNETQIENEGFSHANNLGVDYAGIDGGIDKWICVDGDYKIIGVQPLSTTGFANTLFAIPVDGKGNHEVCMTANYGAGLFTIVFAHQNSVNRNVGDIVKKGDTLYLEGTAGKATGNHIHFEIGVGYITKKIKQKDGKWVTPNGIAPSLNLFLLDGFNKVIRDKETQYNWVSSIDTGEKEMAKFIDGLQKINWLGQTVNAYKQSGKEKIGLISLPMGEVLDITKFEQKGIKIKCIVNCHYFDMGKTNNILGRCQSFTYDGRTLGKDDNNFKGYNGTKDKPFMDLVVLKDGTIKMGDFNSWDFPKDEAIIGVAPAWVGMNNGINVDKFSPECGYGKVTTKNTQTLLLKCSDGSFSFVAVSGKLDLKQCRDMAKAHGCTEVSAYDSGGSTQMLVNGEKIVYTGRKIPTCLVLYEDIEPTPIPPTPIKKIGNIHVEKIGLYVRETLSFKNRKPTGKIKTFIPMGGNMNILGFIKGLQEDGFQWVEVEYNGIVGYSQYDSSCYWIELD